MPDPHKRAQSLLDREAVEGLADADAAWLHEHLAACAECAERVAALSAAIRQLRLAPVKVPANLAARTQMRLYLRVQGSPRRMSPGLVAGFALCWAGGMATAPWVWRMFEWVGHLTGIPEVWMKLALGLWWGVPAAAAATLWSMERQKEMQ
ncbi:MAG TPA: hypothetical protein VN736_24570 [Candidatus Limnocylindrales bacterium]|nr:hypothetical protein [Candidatus Limnocylindrales bacterium]